MGIDCGIKSWHDGGIKDSFRNSPFCSRQPDQAKAHAFVSNNTRTTPRVSRAKRDTMVYRAIIESKRILQSKVLNG